MAILSKRAEQRKMPGGPLRTNLQTAEVNRCEADPEYFISKYVKLKDGSAFKRFSLYPYQAAQLQAFRMYPNIISVQPRASGATVLPLALILWESLFTPDYSVYVGVTRDTSYGYGQRQLQGALIDMYEQLPTWFKPGALTIRSDSVKFPNDATIQFQPAKPATLQGSAGRYNRLFIDSLAQMASPDEQSYWIAVTAHLVTGTKVLISGASNGPSGLFARVWRHANAPGSVFTSLRVPLDECTQFTDTFKNQMRTSLGQAQFRYSFECEF